MTAADWRREEQAQATRLAEVIHAAIEADARALLAEGRQPLLNAVAGALLGVEAMLLAKIGDPAHRKALRKTMERTRPQALAEAIGKNKTVAHSVVIGGSVQ